MAEDDTLEQPLVANGGAKKEGGSVGQTKTPIRTSMAGILVALFVVCGPWSPLPGWLCCLLWVVALVPICALVLQIVIVKAAEVAIESFDREYLGVDVNIEYLFFNAFKGRLEVKDMTIDNPTGYKGRYLLNAQHVVLDLDMRRTVLSMFKEVEIDIMTFEGVTVSLEFDGVFYGKSNLTTILDFLKEARKSKGDIQPVYSFWHTSSCEHTFHFDPAWSGEERGSCVFFAHKQQAEGSQPVYDFWHSWYREHTFRLGEDADCGSLDWRGSVQFYAFAEKMENTEPVHEFWHEGNKEHTLHFLPAWDREEVGPVRFYAYRSDPTGASKVQTNEASIKPVYDFWHKGQGQHQFHFLGPWGGETKGSIQFYAYSAHAPDTEPVYDFYNAAKNKKTFHMGEPREGEERYSKLFWVYTEHKSGTEPVYEFWHEKNQEYNIHMGKPWPGEEKKEVMFYAYKKDPAKERKIYVRQVNLQDIKARSSTKLLGAAVSVDDVVHEDFSTEFDADEPDSLVHAFLDVILKKVSVGLW